MFWSYSLQASSAVNACTRASEWWTALQLANDIFLGEKGGRWESSDRMRFVGGGTVWGGPVFSQTGGPHGPIQTYVHTYHT